MTLILLARNPTASVTRGLLPAAHRLGVQVHLLTDHPAEHRAEYAAAADALGHPPPTIQACDVMEVRTVLHAISDPAIAAAGPVDAIVSNSDHLQTQTALAAQYAGLPGKDWRFALRARDKALMRTALRAAGFAQPASVRLPFGSAGLTHLMDVVSFPAVLKPSEGVASEDVVLVRDHAELAAEARRIWAAGRTGDLVAEAYVEGTLHTMETISDGRDRRVWGGFRTLVSGPPHFIEERLSWSPPTPSVQAALLDQLDALGTGFGACHTEYIVTPGGPVLVEVNDRLIGDLDDFAMAELLGEPIFDDVLRLHLGERLGTVMATRTDVAQPYSHVRLDSLPATSSGVLRSAPGASSRTVSTPAGPALVRYDPSRQPGDVIELSGSNRDYLGILTVHGPDEPTVDRLSDDFIAGHDWVIA